MTAMLERPLTTLAFCWRVARRDGICLGFTTHDRALSIGGLAYRPAPGMLPSAVIRSDGFDAAALDVAGALTSDSISAADLAAGRWDGAAISLFAVDWEQPDGERIMLARGELGEVALKGSAFEAELKGPAALLDRPAVEQTSPDCRAELGDRRCRIDLAPLTRVTRVAAIVAEDVLDVEDASEVSNAYAFGRLRWISGPNCGLSAIVLFSDGTRLTLRSPPPTPGTAGDLVEIVEGCDKLFATCRARFANSENFRGEPHLPGMDLLTRYPGA
ncbi:MAG: hypothetical protein QOH86_2163 [Sphingomonadales bacterium]|jgi:uncharacterized phage protein (TIGR02218 family)|nr:hypothetical protein [Sphingomonadales bacterium]